ncbi:MAG TPA: MarR family transcriptional regulator [Streptosporangiaceae bacterium]|nr:MarR family transcriptional regulator [Streptosporangiaceae bacterium]
MPDGAPARGEYACAAAWTALSAAHALVTGQLAAALAQACGLSIHEFEVLLRVEHAAGGGLRLGALGTMVQLTQPSLSRAVGRLERQGWLRRCGAPGDGRGVLVSITPAGRDVLARGAAVHAETVRTLLLDRLTPDERDLLARALTRVAAGGPASRKEPLCHQPRSA